LTGSFTVKIPGLVARLSVSEPFVFAATLWFGPSVGAVTAALDAMIMSVWLAPGLKTIHRLTFNVSVLVISIWLASQLFFSISGIDVRAPEYTSLTQFIGPLYLFTLCCFLLNSGMVAAALAIERGQSGVRIWREQFLWLSLNYFGGASVAALLVVYAKSIDLAVIGLIIPLLAISYLTFRTTLGRLEDANVHLRELNKLHLSTIETLAMAVDAKDQVTHGHIRRVQRYALGLSSALGIKDERLLRAVEAAALLHDMGKLAIPEYILNKPGKLSVAEFEKMKLHAGLGADILSAIDFPYPVIPIVRHHHENWDGTGYPDLLKGTDIPLGARILSVVDCYDALTSDRPYRPRLSTEQALSIIMQRRGSMYDPLVVDTFVETLAELERSAEDLEPVSPTLQQIAELNAPQPQNVAEKPAFPDEFTVPQLGSPLRASEVAPLALGLVAPSTMAIGSALFMATDGSTELQAVSVAGNVSSAYLGTRTEIGDRVIGWALSTRSVVSNTPIELELGTNSTICRGAKACSAYPILSETNPSVLVIFSAALPGLTELEDKKFRAISDALGKVGIESAQTGVKPHSNVIQAGLLSRFLPSDQHSAAACFPIGVIAVRVHGDVDRFELVARAMVRSGDNVVRLEGHALVVVLQRASQEEVLAVLGRLRTEAQDRDVETDFEWTVLQELTERTDRQVSAVLRTFIATRPDSATNRPH
jgi:putative nucleotidyltransferase with HDIG domain